MFVSWTRFVISSHSTNILGNIH